jgi:hypothetical protein
LLLARRYFEAERRHAGADGRIRHRFHRRGVELILDMPNPLARRVN